MPSLHKGTSRKYVPERKSSGTGDQDFYNGQLWRSCSASFRQENPLCEICQELYNRVQPSEVTDHIVPIASQRGARYNPLNWMALCSYCHNRKRKLESLRIYVKRQPVDEGEFIPLDRREIFDLFARNFKGGVF